MEDPEELQRTLVGSKGVWRSLEGFGSFSRALEDSEYFERHWKDLKGSGRLWMASRALEDSGGFWRTLEGSEVLWKALKGYR